MDFPPTRGAHKTVQLLLDAAPLLCGLLLQNPPSAQIPFFLDDLLNSVGTERTDQLVLQIGGADEKAELRSSPVPGRSVL